MNVPNPPYGAEDLEWFYVSELEKLESWRKNKIIKYVEYKLLLNKLESETPVKRQVLNDRDRRIAQKRMLDQIIARNAIFEPFAYGLGPFFPPSRI